MKMRLSVIFKVRSRLWDWDSPKVFQVEILGGEEPRRHQLIIEYPSKKQTRKRSRALDTQSVKTRGVASMMKLTC